MSEDRIAHNLKISRHCYWLFFIALSLFYVSFTSGTIEGQGYNRENLVAANQFVTNIINVLAGRSLISVEWTRHGCLEPILETPMVLISRLLFGDSIKWAARLAMLQPILATSLLCTLLFVWCHRLTQNLHRAFLLAIAAGLGTMLWPYVYIGLETTQSLALLTAAYLAIGRQSKKSWPETVVFAIACATAVTVKLNGVFLAPAVIFLLFHYFRPAKEQSDKEPVDWRKLAVTLGIVAFFYAINNVTKSHFWSSGDAGIGYYSDLLVDGPFMAVLQAFSYFGSPNKSLFLFCPVLILSFVSISIAFRRQPVIVIFTLLTLAGLVGGFSIIWMWADESWGPRYLHAAIAPLILCLAAAKFSVEFHWRRELAFLTLLVFGFWCSLLGGLFSYDALHKAAIDSSQATLDAIQYDPRWNHVRFNSALLKTWLGDSLKSSSQPQLWPPAKRWWFTKPLEAPPEKTVDLREFAAPQILLLRRWQPTTLVSPSIYLLLRCLCFMCLLLSLFIWAQLIRLMKRTRIDVEEV